MTTTIDSKLSRLKGILLEYDSVLVAFSGGVDSSFLLSVAGDVLGDKVMAVTVASEINPPGEVAEAVELARLLGVKHRLVKMDPLQDKNFYTNPPLRCYYCKRIIMGRMLEIAGDEGLRYVLDGANVNDTRDYRPGMQAAQELGIKHPLLEAGLTKADIRQLSRLRQLPTWEKPSAACLASRFPYGTRITGAGLEQVVGAETFLRNKGFTQVRVRYHGKLARIEAPREELPKLFGMSGHIVAELKALGFIYVTLDLEGYRTGSMNETL